nr:MAG TPA: hypothetical protein [Caudoviricetes sp.]
MEIIKTIILILSSSFMLLLFYTFVYKIINPFYYKISWVTTDNVEQCLYVKMLKEMSLTTYQEIPSNIIKNYIGVTKVLKESIKIERIYINKYTNLELFDKKDYF